MAKRQEKRQETQTAAAPLKPVGLLTSLGPGLVTGAADDDPSGIATYSQVGAQFGYGLAWTMLFSFPLMAVIQSIAARIGLALQGRNSGWRNAMLDRPSFRRCFQHKNRVPTVEHKTPFSS